jgi:L-amino acid N-acyltransferase YncA
VKDSSHTDPAADQAGSLHVFDLRHEQIEPRPVAGVRFIRLHQALSGDLAAAMAVDEQEVQARRAAGNTCAVALLDEGIVAGYGWVSFEAIRVYELEVNIPIPRGEAYIWDCATIAAQRGRGIFSGLLCFMLEDLRQAGYRRAWGGVAPGNVPSLRAFSRAGFRRVGRVSMGFQEAWVEPLPTATAEEAQVLRAFRHQPQLGPGLSHAIPEPR